MAETTIQMEALGEWHEACAGCQRHFKRGETMNGLVLDKGEPGGWWCDRCLRRKEKACST